MQKLAYSVREKMLDASREKDPEKGGWRVMAGQGWVREELQVRTETEVWKLKLSQIILQCFWNRI